MMGPWQVEKNEAPDLSHLRPFGATVYSALPHDGHKQARSEGLDAAAEVGCLVGISTKAEGYLVYFPHRGRNKSGNVLVHIDASSVAGSTVSWWSCRGPQSHPGPRVTHFHHRPHLVLVVVVCSTFVHNVLQSSSSLKVCCLRSPFAVRCHVASHSLRVLAPSTDAGARQREYLRHVWVASYCKRLYAWWV